MKCPLCGHMEDKVIESRQNISGTTLRRRRECLGCAYRFTSYERIEEIPLMVVKSDGRREPFDIEKAKRGLTRALEKRPVSQMTIEEVLNQIEDEAAMAGKSNHEISARLIGDMVLNKLSALDQVAYIRFASVYKKFSDVQEFIREIEKIK
ncbi:MAG: transcriptional regulator NrdR [Spirochaetes bacterium GWB1_48_6]|nr:MAG: transcriptional regulator NrdR [Spirochaetes bacterium GWB1_48_6]